MYCLNNSANKADYNGNKPGDLFDTLDEAARDFAEYINGTSIRRSWFTRFLNYLFIGSPITNTIKKRVKVTKYTYVEPEKGTAPSSKIPINWFWRHNQVALFHTHGAYSPGYENDAFSSADKNLAIRRKIPFMLPHLWGL